MPDRPCPQMLFEWGSESKRGCAWSVQGGSVLQAAPAVHSEHTEPAGDLNSKALHLEPASAAINGDGVLNNKRSETTAA